jgi:hypothetical protein
MVHSDGKVSSIIVPAEFGSGNFSLFEGARFGHRFEEFWFFFDSARSPAADAVGLGMFGK